MNNVHFSSKSIEWSSPQDLYDKLNNIYSFNLDVCATKDNAKCEEYYTKEDDGLSKDWFGKRCWMNPPYGREIKQWVKKASETGTLVVCLLPARTDTSWWHDYIIPKAISIEFIRGRLKFGGHENPAPFPSAIVVFNGEK